MKSLELFGIDGKLALVTGAGSGLGRHFSQVLAQSGAEVILCGRRVDKLEETAGLIRESGGVAHVIAMDVSSGESVLSAFEKISILGTLAILVNNAGAVSGPMLTDLDEDTWDVVLDVNLKGAWLVARESAKLMIESGGGSIVNISSVISTSVQKGTGAYAAAKAGLSHLTRAMSLEWALYGIRVNAIAPGYFRTDISTEYLDSPKGKEMIKRIPQRTLGEFNDLSGVLLLLCSDASSYMTGSSITVDGGLSLSVI